MRKLVWGFRFYYTLSPVYRTTLPYNYRLHTYGIIGSIGQLHHSDTDSDKVSDKVGDIYVTNI